MNSLLKNERVTDDFDSPFFNITTWLDQTGDLFIRSCEVIGRQFRNRTSFGDGVLVSVAFSDQMSAALSDCIMKLSNKTEILVLPDLVLELPDLVLGGVRIVATKLEDGTTNIMIRFMRFAGSIRSAFRNSIGMDFSIVDKSSVLGARVLRDIAAPLLNICSALENEVVGAPETLGGFGAKIVERSHEIRFHIELLSRLVNQQTGNCSEQFERMSATTNLDNS